MTWLGLLNFVVLQWFGVRLARRFRTVYDVPASQYVDVLDTTLYTVLTKAYGIEAMQGHAVPRPLPTKLVQDGWIVLRWIWPLTGWWSTYRWIARRT